MELNIITPGPCFDYDGTIEEARAVVERGTHLAREEPGSTAEWSGDTFPMSYRVFDADGELITGATIRLRESA